MSLPWFRVDVDLVDHPKTWMLAEEVGDPNAVAYVLRLLSWTGRFAALGRLADVQRRALESALGWRGEAGELIAALIKTGWLDEVTDDDGSPALEVHEWWERQGAAVVKAEKDAERKRLARAKAKEQRGDGARTARGRRGDGAGDETRRDETRRDDQKIAGDVAPASPGDLFEPEQPAERPTEKPKRPPKSPDTDSRHHPLKESLVAAGAPFDGGRDARQVQRLLALSAQSVGPEKASAEVLDRWRRAQRHQGYPRVRSLTELATHWGHFGSDSGRPGDEAPMFEPSPTGIREVAF